MKIINRNNELSLLWSIFLIKKEKEKNFKFKKLFDNFKNFDNFEEKILILKKKIFQKEKQLSFFEKDIKEIEIKIEKLKKKILDNWNYLNVKSISKFDFKNIELLKNIKNTNFLFFKGNEKIFEISKKDIITVVGSRKTPINFSKKINKEIAINKIIVSGLAYGADLMAHKEAKKNKQKIIVFPGKDITKKELNFEKNEILEYAKKNGLIFSEVVPNSNMWNKSFLLKRNKTMAQISSITYVVWFKGQSGTLGQVLEAVRNKNKIFMFKEIFENNKKYLENHHVFKEILNTGLLTLI